MAVAAKKLTWDDIKDWPEDAGRKTELVDGRVVVSPSSGRPHSLANLRLAEALIPFVREGNLGELHVAPIDCVLASETVYQPDLCFIRRGREGILTDRIEGAPDLAIEILSPSNRAHDTEVKFRDYARFGVAEYWIVDPESKTVRTFANRGGRFELLAESADREPVATEVLSGLKLTAYDVFDDEI